MFFTSMQISYLSDKLAKISCSVKKMGEYFTHLIPPVEISIFAKYLDSLVFNQQTKSIKLLEKKS